MSQVEDKTMKTRLTETLERFLKIHKKRGSGKRNYMENINGMLAAGTHHIVVDYLDLDSALPDVSKQLATNPDDVLEAFNDATKAILKDIHPDYYDEVKDRIKVRISNFTYQKELREINADIIDRFICASGMIVRASEVKPLATMISYKCENCNVLTQASLQGLILKKPSKCPACSEKEFDIDAKNSKFVDFRFVRMQELPEELPAGQLPHYVDIVVIGDLVKSFRPGDRVILTGIVRIEREALNNQVAQSGNLFRLRLEANNIEHRRGGIGDDDRITVTKEDEQKIKAFASRDDAYEKIVESMVPHIYGHEIIKEAISLLIVGSPVKKLDDGSTKRGDINVLLVGDPGIAKSEMLKFAARVAPRGLYTSGRGSSAAGLTAAVLKDKSNMMMLEAGAVVLADQGLCAIDEFDKINSNDRSALHEVMEQQTCSVAKGGIVATLNARTSILAAANPIHGKYDPGENILDNVNLPVPLLTRFDLIFIVRDTPEEKTDELISGHILDIYSGDAKAIKSPMDMEFLSKYLLFARKGREPKLSRDAHSIIQKFYMSLRKVDSQNMIAATPRQLEGLVRLATARSKLLLKDVVDAEDAQRAMYLVSEMLSKVGVDVNTGKIDMGVMYGKPESHTTKVKLFFQVFEKIEAEVGYVTEKQLKDELVSSDKFSDEYDVKKMFNMAWKEGQIYERQPGWFRRG